MISRLINASIILLFVITFGFHIQNIDCEESVHLNQSENHGLFGNASKYVIIDTDVGVDDALALMMAFDSHKRGHITILALTCTYGNGRVDQVIKNVFLLNKFFGTEDIKVFKGCSTSLLQNNVSYTFFGEDALQNVTYSVPDIKVEVEAEHAVLAMIRLAKEYPKQITMITLGPMTNLAMAIQMEPSFTRNLHQIISLGGVIDPLGNMLPTTEYNFHLDPESVAMVFKKSECPLIIGTWDVALNHVMPMEDFAKLKQIGNKKSKFLEKIYDSVLEEDNVTKGIVLCDVICVITFIHPELVTKSPRYPVAMELSGRFSRGQLVVGRTKTLKEPKSYRTVNFIEKIDLRKSIQLIIEMTRNCC